VIKSDIPNKGLFGNQKAVAMKMAELKRVFALKKDINGSGPVIFAWHPDGSYIACAGSSRVVNIANRRGEPIAEIPLSGCARRRAQPDTLASVGLTAFPPRSRCAPRLCSQCLALDWDKDGQVLAVLQSDSVIVPLWDAHQHKLSNLDTNMRDLTFLKWSLTGPQV
jgi:WD repeat-containing protein 19